MAMLKTSRDANGKLTMEFSNWAVPIVIFLLTFASQFIINGIRSDERHDVSTQVVEKRLTNLEENQKHYLPAEQLVEKTTFDATINAMQRDIKRIDDNVTWIARKNGKKD